MAQQLFNRLGQVGLGVAIFGGVVNSALYNGNYVVWFNRHVWPCLCVCVKMTFNEFRHNFSCFAIN